MKIGLTFDLRETYLNLGYSEDETAELDKEETIVGIEQAIETLGHKTIRIGNLFDLQKRLLSGERWDLVFNICEGMHGIGREGQVPSILDAYQIPYTFSDPLVLSLTLHKGLTKRVLRDAGIATADFYIVQNVNDVYAMHLPFPVFVKPIAEGSGKGIDGRSIVNDKSRLLEVCGRLLKDYNQEVLVESFLNGREFTVGIAGTGEDAICVGVMEVKIDSEVEEQAYSRFIKENYDGRVHYSSISGSLFDACAKICLDAWRVLGCRDAGRVDIRFDDKGNPFVIEVNPLPGLNYIHSDLPILMYKKGFAYIDLIGMILHSASKRIVT
ncbi:MAG: D-alanine--D-alanine ligase [Bacteroidetes bacterium HGW-Bacteroidetes-1]|nr:MAG: D-alanine--D-alanine ligase [Bacteroidetes bacterium HGW-Bacteroidetes-1]